MIECTHRYDAQELLGSSRYRRFLELDPMGVQLPSFIATVERLKPAMDLWVPYPRISEVENVANYFGLKSYIDVLFDRHDESVLGRFSTDRFNTTRAVLASVKTERCEAHVFVACDDAALNEVVSSGWYPLVVDDEIVGKPYPDHNWFGQALGYPDCCRRFFKERNNWSDDNTYFAAYQGTEGEPLAFCNSLTKHTALYLAPHMPCSFRCNATLDYAKQLSSIIQEDSPLYLKAIFERLRNPMLCLSETRLFMFRGHSENDRLIKYCYVEPIPPTTESDPLFLLLNKGDLLRLNGCVIQVLKGTSHIGSYLARTDIHGPEVPFIIECK